MTDPNQDEQVGVDEVLELCMAGEDEYEAHAPSIISIMRQYPEQDCAEVLELMRQVITDRSRGPKSAYYIVRVVWPHQLVRDCLLYNSEFPSFADSFLNHKIISNIMTLTVGPGDHQITERLDNLYPPPADRMWVDRLNRVAMKLIFELKALGGEPENGQPSPLEVNYLVAAAHQKCLEKGAPFEKIDKDEDIGQPSINIPFEDDPQHPEQDIFDPDDPFVQGLSTLRTRQTVA